MIYYKDINGNIYAGDKADYRDIELTEQELSAYLSEKENLSKINNIKQGLNSFVYCVNKLFCRACPGGFLPR